ERGSLAAGINITADDLEGCQAVICFGPPAPGRIPASATFVAVWDTVLRPEHGDPDVVLPALSFAETQGSYTNLEGRVQFLRPILSAHPPRGEGWDLLGERALGFGAPGRVSLGVFQIQRGAARAIPGFGARAAPPPPDPPPTPVLYGPARP